MMQDNKSAFSKIANRETNIAKTKIDGIKRLEILLYIVYIEPPKITNSSLDSSISSDELRDYMENASINFNKRPKAHRSSLSVDIFNQKLGRF